MDKTELTALFKRIKRVYPMFGIPQDKEAAREMIDDWHAILADVPFDVAVHNLRRHTLDPDNKYPPHPGALARPIEQKTEFDRYHEWMRESGQITITEYEQMRARAVGPTPEQRERVRRVFERT